MSQLLKPARSRGMTLAEAAYQELRDAIFSDAYGPGEQLPTEVELGELLGVSRTVVREALRTLEEDGLVIRRHGVGTFVRSGQLLKNVNFNAGITERIRASGRAPGVSILEIHQRSAVAIDDKVKRQLKLKDDTPVTVLERLHTANGKPAVYTIDVFPRALLEGAPLDAQQLADESLYNVLYQEYGVVIEYGVARVLPVFPAPRILQRLSVPEPSLILYLGQTNYHGNAQPLFYEHQYHAPDFLDFVIWRKGSSRLQDTWSSDTAQRPL